MSGWTWRSELAYFVYRFWWALAAVALLALLPIASCWGQQDSLFVHTPGRPVMHVTPVVLVAPAIRDSLAKVWDDTDPDQVERAYCVAWHGAIFMPEKVLALRLDSLVKPDTVMRANGYSVTSTCRPKTIPLHTHTPVTCEGGAPVRGAGKPVCALGGIDAWQCFGSPADIANLEYLGLPFGIVQCDRYALVAFFPRPVDQR